MRVGAGWCCALSLAMGASPGHLGAQAPSRPDSAAVAAQLVQIRARVTSTNRDLATNRVVRRELQGFSAEGGHLDSYFAAGTLRKIDAWSYGESGRLHEEYYVRDDAPYFALITAHRYDHSERRRIVHTYRTRLYLDAGRLIAWTDSTGRNRAATGHAAEDQVHDALESYRQLRDCASKASGDTCEAPRDSSTQ